MKGEVLTEYVEILLKTTLSFGERLIVSEWPDVDYRTKY
jgi:hypothetical protein